MKLCPKCQKQFSDDANFCPVDAARLQPLEAQAGGADSLAARFDLGPKLGGSRTGAVHRATDKTTGQAVVVKIVSPAVVQLPGVAQRLERELRQLERVQSAGVARVIVSGKRQDDTWVAMELLDGAHTLAEAITARGPVAPDQAADLIEVVGEALIEAAQVGVVHRDLAPKNVLFAGQDVKLINFSLPVPTTDKVPGVAEFVAPEQVDGRPVDQRSNLYSLGALYYFVLTGQPLFVGNADEVHRQHQGGAIKPPSQLVGSVAPGSAIEGVIMRALDRSPTKRFLTVRQFVDEVARVGHGEVIELKNAVPRQKPKAELVSTLMGVREAPSRPVQAPPPAIASAPTVGTGVPSVAQPKVGSAPVPMASTMVGVASGATPAPLQAPPMSAAPMHAAQTQLGAPPGYSAPATLVTPPPVMTPPPVSTAPGVGPAQPVQPAQPAQPAQPPQMMQAQIVPESAASPWAAPAQTPAAPVVAVPVVAVPVVAAPVVAAPVVAAPVVAQQAAGKQKAPEAAGQKGKFRETMWFKKGDLDAQAAVAAAEERARTGKDSSTDKADMLPMDERYKDDGSISRGDKEKYSLRTGGTQMMAAVRADPSMSGKVSEDALIGEMKGGRSKVLIAIAVAVVALALIIVLAAT